MNKDYPPFQLFSPEIAPRRSERPRIPSYTPEVLQRRQEIARTLLAQINPLSNELRRLSDEERKAVFFKLEHEGTIKLEGTDLKPITEPTANITLAVPRSDSLDKLVDKVEAFGDAQIRTDRAGRDHVTNEGLVIPLKTIAQGSATDRLSQPLFEQYRNLVRRKWIIFEIEIIAPLAKSPNQQRTELHRILADLERVFANGIHGTIFEHEEIKGTIRAVIRCTGQIFKRLVLRNFS